MSADLEPIVKAINEAGLPAQEAFNALAALPGMSGANNGSFFESGKFMVVAAGDAVKPDLAIGHDQCIWAYRDGVYSRAEDEVQHRATKLLGNMWTRNRAAEIEANLRARRVLPELPEKPDMDWINLRNGMYAWQLDRPMTNAPAFVKHSPAFESTVQLAFDYDPQATCPEFDAWLARAVPADAVDTAWEVLGYMLMSGNPLQRAILLHGPTDTGKSTYERVLEHMIGKANISAVTLQELSEGGFKVAEMEGKLANIVGDLDGKYLADTGKFKQITGEDGILVEEKYKKPHVIHVWATPIFSANSFWRSSDTSTAYLDRFVVLSFPHKLKGTTPGFSEQALWDEAPGIFNKAMDALRRLMDRDAFKLDGSLADVHEEFERESDIVRRWLADDESIQAREPGSEGYMTKRSHVYEAYRKWSQDGGLKAMSNVEFYKRMKELGFIVKKNGEMQVYGIRIEHRVPGYGDFYDSAAARGQV